MKIDSTAIEYFHNVAKFGSVSRAATEAGVEPSTLTRHITRLEEEIGTRLFHRSGRGMVLTVAGTILLQQGEKMIDALEQTRRVAADLASDGPSQVVIAAQPTLAQVVFSPLMQALREKFPNAKIRLVEGLGHHMVTGLHEGKVDVALLYVPPNKSVADYDALMQEPLYAVLPPTVKCPGPSMPVEAFLDMPLVLPSTPHGLRALAESWAEHHGKPLRIAVESDTSTYMTRRLVQAGHGCTILPLAAVQSDLDQGLLQAVRLQGIGVTREVAIATAINRPPVTGLWDFTRLIRRVVSELVTTRQWPGIEQMAPQKALP
jgi:LysR family nitrogen assimilation transcriptional regulator